MVGFQDRPDSGGLNLGFDVPADAAGPFRIWALENAPNGASDDVFIRIDDGQWFVWNLARIQSVEWVWDGLNDSSDTLEFDLAAGHHVLHIVHREAGAAIDKFVITNDRRRIPGGSDTGLRASDSNPGDATQPLR